MSLASPESQPSNNQSDQNFSSSDDESNSKSKSRSDPLCGKCRNHGIKVNTVGHKRFCKYTNCDCPSCKFTEDRRQSQKVYMQQTREQRTLRKRKMLPGEVDPKQSSFKSQQLNDSSVDSIIDESNSDQFTVQNEVYVSTTTSNQQQQASTSSHKQQESSNSSYRVENSSTDQEDELYRKTMIFKDFKEIPEENLKYIYALLKATNGNDSRVMELIVEGKKSVERIKNSDNVIKCSPSTSSSGRRNRSINDLNLHTANMSPIDSAINLSISDGDKAKNAKDIKIAEVFVKTEEKDVEIASIMASSSPASIYKEDKDD